MILHITKFFTLVGKNLSLALFIYLTTTQLSQYLIPANSFFDSRIYVNSYFRFILSIGLITLFSSACIELLFGRLKYVSIFSQSKNKLIAYFLISLLFSTYYQQNIESFVSYFGFIFYFLFFIITFPTMLRFLQSNKNPYLINVFADSKVKKKNSIQFLPKVLLISLFCIFIFFTFLIVVNIAKFYFDGSLDREQALMKKLYIKSVNPSKTIHANKVIIEGYNFGWKNNSDWRLMSKAGPINTEFWQDTRIDFITPFSLPEGTTHIWVEKPSRDSPPNQVIISSNRVALTVLNRFAFYPNLGDNPYVKGLKKIKLFIFEKFNWISDHIF